MIDKDKYIEDFINQFVEKVGEKHRDLAVKLADRLWEAFHDSPNLSEDPTVEVDLAIVNWVPEEDWLWLQ